MVKGKFSHLCSKFKCIDKKAQFDRILHKKDLELGKYMKKSKGIEQEKNPYIGLALKSIYVFL